MTKFQQELLATAKRYAHYYYSDGNADYIHQGSEALEKLESLINRCVDKDMKLQPYNKLGICPDCSETKDIVMVEFPEVYDGGLYWQCLHCPTAWHRSAER